MLTFIMQSFTLSFSILWRALPMWGLLVAILYVLLSMLWEQPAIFIFLLFAGAGTIMYFMMFSHIRSGLSVLGETTPPDLGKLAVKSFRFFRFVALWTGLVTALSFAGFFTLGYLGLFDWTRMLELLAEGTPQARTELEAMFRAPGFYGYTVISSTLSQLAYCAIAVPMAANAAACSPKARDYEIFWGFGAFTGRMFVLNLCAGTVLTVLAVAYVVLGLGMTYMSLDGLTEDSLAALISGTLTWRAIVTIAAMVMLPVVALVWWISLWCAGATLCFVERRNISRARFAAEIECIYEEPMDAAELRALRMSRMGGSAPAAG